MLKDMLDTETQQLPKTVAGSFKSPKRKKKMKFISAYVNIEDYEKFKEINYELGESNNSVLNSLIKAYINKNKNLL